MHFILKINFQSFELNSTKKTSHLFLYISTFIFFFNKCPFFKKIYPISAYWKPLLREILWIYWFHFIKRKGNRNQSFVIMIPIKVEILHLFLYSLKCFFAEGKMENGLSEDLKIFFRQQWPPLSSYFKFKYFRLMVKVFTEYEKE